MYRKAKVKSNELRRENVIGNTEDNPGNVSRDAELVVRAPEEGEGEEQVVDLTASTERATMEIVDYNDSIQWAYRKLEHSNQAIDRTYMQDGLVVTDTHGGDQIGIIRNPKIANKKLSGTVEWSSTERAQAIKKDALAGIRKNVSIDGRVDESSYQLDGEQDGYPVLRAKKWQPHRVAFVSIGADPKSGVGRELQTNLNGGGKMAEGEKTQEQTSEMERRLQELEGQIEQAQKEGEEKAQTERANRNEEILNMRTLAKYHNVSGDVLERAISENKTMQEFRQIVREAVKNGEVENHVEPGSTGDAVPQEEQKKFSVNRALRSLMGDKVDATFEREMSDELSCAAGKEPQGIFVPTGALARDLNTGGDGGNVVQDNMRTGEMIELLRNQLVLNALGVDSLEGLEGNQEIPKHSSASTAYWVAEGEDVQESEQGLGQVQLVPHTCGAVTDITRRFLRQASVDAERFVTNDLMRSLAIEIDRAGIHGKGTDGQPLGLMKHLSQESVNQVTVSSDGSPTYAEWLDFEKKIETNNAAIGGLRWAMNPSAKNSARDTDLGSSSGIKVLPPAGTEILGYPMVTSNQIGSSGDNYGSAILGVWTELVLAMWGALDINVDPYSKSKSGALRVVALQDVDYGVRHPEAFAFCSNEL